jgi:hypothetical protein
MYTSPPVNEIQELQNRQHLKLLAVFHFVLAGLALLGIGFVFLHYMIFSTLFSDPNFWKNMKGAQPPQLSPEKVLEVLKWVYVFFGAVLLIAGILDLLAGLFLLRAKHRIFCLVVGAINCLQIPLGTILGVFTIIVLSRDSVRQLFNDDNPLHRQGF